MTIKLIIAPASEPVTLAEAKLHLRVDHNDEDALISAFITAAREQCEHIIGRALMAQTWEVVLDAFPSDADIELPHPPIQSVTHIKYLDAASIEQTLSSSLYALDKDSEPGWVILSGNIPSTADVANAVRVRYVAGYADAASVPSSIRMWILLATKFIYDGCASGDAPAVPVDFYGGLLDRYRIWRL